MDAQKSDSHRDEGHVKTELSLRDRLFAPVSEAELARRRAQVEEIRRLRTSIAPLTVLELRRLARLDAAGERDDDRGQRAGA